MAYNEPDYSQNWQEWLDIAKHQEKKDEALFPDVMKWFLPGEILEIGSGIGQLSKRAIDAGHNVTPSDYEQSFVDYMKQSGLSALQVDARNIAKSTGGKKWNTIFSQGASPYVTTEMYQVEEAYQSAFDNLEDGGRFVLIIARAKDRSRFSRIGDHTEIASKVGFNTLTKFRNQVLPSQRYGGLLASIVEPIAGPLFGLRDIAVYERPKQS